MKSAMGWRDAARWICTAAVALAVGAGLAYAKLPQPPMDDAAKAKAEEGKAKAAEAARKEAEQPREGAGPRFRATTRRGRA